MPRREAPPLRIGVTLAGSSVPRWAARTLDLIDACSFAELAGCVRVAEPQRSPGGIRAAWSRLLYELYCRLDARRAGGGQDPLAEVDIADRLARLPGVTTTPGAAPSTAIGAWELDVMLALGPHAVLDCARYGTWCHQHGDGEPPLFWEVHDAAPVATSALHRISAGSLEVLSRSASATDRLSLHRSRTRVYAKSPHLAVRKLRDVHRDGELEVLERADRSQTPAVRGHAPTNRQMLRFGARLASRLARRKARAAIARQQWFLAYARRRPGLPTTETFRGATLLVPPRDRFYADPCLVERAGVTYLFFEEFAFAERKGVVSCCQLTPDGRCGRPEVVLERPYHLSYPFVFWVGDEAFMVPETAANGAIELYRANAFPSGWVLDAVLISDVRAVDPTVVQYDGRWWLFANVAVDGASHDDELCLFTADAIRGPWEPHPRNPVISDVRRARPAGRPFADESGRLIRPSQDCSGLYGASIVLNRIDALGRREYRETPIGRLESGWHRRNLGTHTYTRSNAWEAVDGRAWRLRAPTARR